MAIYIPTSSTVYASEDLLRLPAMLGTEDVFAKYLSNITDRKHTITLFVIESDNLPQKRLEIVLEGTKIRVYTETTTTPIIFSNTTFTKMEPFIRNGKFETAGRNVEVRILARDLAILIEETKYQSGSAFIPDSIVQMVTAVQRRTDPEGTIINLITALEEKMAQVPIGRIGAQLPRTPGLQAGEHFITVLDDLKKRDVLNEGIRELSEARISGIARGQTPDMAQKKTQAVTAIVTKDYLDRFFRQIVGGGKKTVTEEFEEFVKTNRVAQIIEDLVDWHGWITAFYGYTGPTQEIIETAFEEAAKEYIGIVGLLSPEERSNIKTRFIAKVMDGIKERKQANLPYEVSVRLKKLKSSGAVIDVGKFALSAPDQMTKSLGARNLSDAFGTTRVPSGLKEHVNQILAAPLQISKPLYRQYTPYQDLISLIDQLKSIPKSGVIPRILDFEGWIGDNITLTTQLGVLDVADCAKNFTEITKAGSQFMMSSRPHGIHGKVDEQTATYLKDELLKMWSKAKAWSLDPRESHFNPNDKNSKLLMNLGRMIIAGSEDMETQELRAATMAQLNVEGISADTLLDWYEKALHQKMRHHKFEGKGTKATLSEFQELIKTTFKDGRVFMHNPEGADITHIYNLLEKGSDPIAYAEAKKLVQSKTTDSIAIFQYLQELAMVRGDKSWEDMASTSFAMNNLVKKYESLMGGLTTADLHLLGKNDAYAAGRLMIISLNAAMNDTTAHSMADQVFAKSVTSETITNNLRFVAELFDENLAKNKKLFTNIEDWIRVASGIDPSEDLGSKLVHEGIEVYSIVTKPLKRSDLELWAQRFDVTMETPVGLERLEIKPPRGLRLGQVVTDDPSVWRAGTALKTLLQMDAKTNEILFSFTDMNGIQHKFRAKNILALNNLLAQGGFETTTEKGMSRWINTLMDDARRLFDNLTGSFNEDPNMIGRIIEIHSNNIRNIIDHSTRDPQIAGILDKTSELLAAIKSGEPLFDTTNPLGHTFMQNMFDLHKLDWLEGGSKSIAEAVIFVAQHKNNLEVVDTMLGNQMLLHHLTKSMYTGDARSFLMYDQELADRLGKSMEEISFYKYSPLAEGTVLDNAVLRIGDTDSSVIVSMNAHKTHDDIRAILSRTTDKHSKAARFLADEFLGETIDQKTYALSNKTERKVLGDRIAAQIIKESQEINTFRRTHSELLYEPTIAPGVATGKGRSACGRAIFDVIHDEEFIGRIVGKGHTLWEELKIASDTGRFRNFPDALMQYGNSIIDTISVAAEESGRLRDKTSAANIIMAFNNMGIFEPASVENRFFPQMPKIQADISKTVVKNLGRMGMAAAAIPLIALGAARPPLRGLEELPVDEAFDPDFLQGKTSAAGPPIVIQKPLGITINIDAKGTEGRYDLSNIMNSLRHTMGINAEQRVTTSFNKLSDIEIERLMEMEAID